VTRHYWGAGGVRVDHSMIWYDTSNTGMVRRSQGGAVACGSRALVQVLLKRVLGVVVQSTNRDQYQN